MREVIEIIYREANGFDKNKITKFKIIKGCYKAMEKDDSYAKPKRQKFLKITNRRNTVTSLTEEQESSYPENIEEES